MGMLYRLMCQRANKNREAAGVAESFENAYVDDMTDVSNLHFRYIY